MKLRTSFLKRCLALAMALALLVSGTNLGAAFTVLASETTAAITDGELVANNYSTLTEAEKALLSSGILAGATHAYTIPDSEDDLVTVDTDNAKITADTYENWVPVSASIVVGGASVEEVALTNGEGTYTYDGNAFSVVVKYVLNIEVSEATQETLLNTAGWLVDGIANIEAVKSTAGSLTALELAMPELVKLAKDGYTIFGSPVTLDEEVCAAIYELNDQMTANGGKVNMSVMLNNYSAGKTSFLLNDGVEMKAELENTTANIKQINKALNTIKTFIDSFGSGSFDQSIRDLVGTLWEVLNTWSTTVDPVIAAEWTAAEKGTALVVADANYAKLDVLVAGLGELSPVPGINNPLKADETEIQKNLAMYNVTVSVVLKAVKDNEIVEIGTKSTVLTLAEGATSADILAAVEESGIVDTALADWADVYVEKHFTSSNSELPAGGLYADMDYTVTYSPVDYTVDIAGDVNEYPYGYVVTLPVHEDANKSYDYRDAEGTYYPQGSKVLVDKDLAFTRTTGKAYTTGKLLTVLAGNYAADNEKVTAIMTSGALSVDESFAYRKPSTEELENLVTLTGNVLTANTYPSSYNNLSWAADTYVVDGVSHDFNGQTTVTINGEFDEVHVYYSLVLTNYTKSDVKEIFDLIVTLNNEAEGQLSVLNRLNGYGEQMSILNKDMMLGLQAMVQIQGMKDIIGQMMDGENGCFDANGNLLLNNIIASYNDANNGGLYYYYTNDSLVRGEISKLSTMLKELLGSDEYKKEIERLLGNMGYGEYTEKLDDLSAKLDEVAADLAAKNAAIETSEPGALRKLANALAMTGDVAVAEYDSPYISMEPVVRVADKFAAVTINVTVNGVSNTNPITAKVLKGEKLTAAQIAELKAAVEAFVASTGINTKYYNTNYNASELDALAVNPLDSNVTFEYEWTKATYAVDVPGAATQYVDIDNLTITLPAHPDALYGMSYEYTIDGITVPAGIYTLTVEQLDKLIAGTLVITRTEKNEAAEKLVNMVNNINKEMKKVALTLVEKDGVYTGIDVNMGIEDMMNFIMGLTTKSGYDYIGLGGEGFKYATADGLEISIQTLINAVLKDEGFNNDRVIALANNGKGNVVTTTMQLGNSAAEVNYNLTFTINLNSVPAALTNNAALVKTVSNYIKFQSNNGELDVSVNLPDKVYGAYAAALIATGNVDKTDVNELSQKVAVQFVYDYLTAVTGSEADMITFTNTMKMLGLSQDLTGYNKYYTAGVDAYNKYVDVTISDDVTTIDVSAPGKTSINALLKLTGMGAEGLTEMLAMVKEYKDEATIDVTINGKLTNPDKTYYALIVDAQANGVTNKFEAPSSVKALQEQTKTLAGYSAMILLDDVDGNLTIGGTTVLDLNGKSVSGKINATGKLFIIDSSMDTYEAGTVGSVSGNAVILGGNYNADVSAFLKDGYYMDGTTVRNTLYYITDKDNEVTFVFDANIEENGIPNVKALAIDIAADLVLNYIYTAKLAVNGYELIDVQINDLLGIAADRDVNNLAKQLLACVTIGEAGYENKVGFEGLVNEILDDLLDFETISNGLKNNEALATYEITTEPWEIELEHITDGNYMTVNVTSNDDLVKNFKVSLVIESKYNDALAALTGELANIVEDRTDIEVDIPTPTYSNKTLTITGAGKAEAYVDMSKNSDYAVMIATVLAYGNAAKREAVAAAINSGNINDLKAVVDGTSVKELFTALKVMARNVNFQAMADAVGITADVTSAAELEAIYHVVLCGAGKVLEELDITGRDSKLGNLYNEETGYYELSKENMFRDAELNIRSYTALVELTVDVLSLNVKLFDDCMIGDVNHDDVIDGTDASLVLEYVAEMEPATFCFRGADTNGDGVIDGTDASLILEYVAEMRTNFPAESK